MLGVCAVEKMAGAKSARLCEKQDGSEIGGRLENEARGETGNTWMSGLTLREMQGPESGVSRRMMRP